MKIPATKIIFPQEDRKHLLKKMDEILETGSLTLGKYTKEFEERFAEYIGTKYAVAVNSGTSALEISLRTLDVNGSSVIVPTNTFFATPASVIHAGGKVIFADTADNLCIDPESINENIIENTKGVILVHIGGIIPPQIKEIKEPKRYKNPKLIFNISNIIPMIKKTRLTCLQFVLCDIFSLQLIWFIVF